jgi:hypothetical protein
MELMSDHATGVDGVHLTCVDGPGECSTQSSEPLVGCRQLRHGCAAGLRSPSMKKIMSTTLATV